MKLRSLLLYFCIATQLIKGFAQAPSSITNEVAQLSEDALIRYETFLDKQIAAKHLPGAVTLIYRNGEVGYFEARGYSEMGSQKPMTTDKLFYIQSMTKPIVSVGIMQLFEEGHFY